MFFRHLFSTDHKVIGLLYGFTSLFFLLVGFVLVVIMRWQLAYPGAIAPETYNGLGALHGTIMVFLGVVPLAVGAFGNYVVPLQIGAPDMAFPRINLASWWFYAVGGVIMLASFFARGGAPMSGWTSYPPLADFAPSGQTFWLFGMLCLVFSSLLGALNFITTIVQLRAPGLTWFRLPFFVWAQFITCLLYTSPSPRDS